MDTQLLLWKVHFLLLINCFISVTVGTLCCRSWCQWSPWWRCSPAAPRGHPLEPATPMWTSFWGTWIHSGWFSCSWSRYQDKLLTDHNVFVVFCFFLSGVQWSMCVCVLVHRAWSCVESSPCRWKTWCPHGTRDSPCHPVRSPCYNAGLSLTEHAFMCIKKRAC